MLSGWSISISFVCPLSHLKTDWPKGCLTGGSAGLPVGSSDGRGRTGCGVFPSCASRLCSYLPGWPPTCPITQGRLCPHHALPQWGKWWLKRDSHQQEKQWSVCLILPWMWRKTERSDGRMMYLQTVWQRKSVTAGVEIHITRRAGREKES